MDPSKALLTGKVAIVTGAGQGIGKGIALGMANFGARVAVIDLNPETAEQTAAEIRAAGGEALDSRTDVRDLEAVQAMVQQVAGQWGGVDILVNNVGGTFRRPFLEVNERGWEAVIRANLKSTLNCCYTVAPVMIEQGRGGSIINITTIESWRAGPGFAVYSAAKGGIRIFTKSLALELAAHQIRVNCVAPDFIVTPGVSQGLGSSESRKYHIPLGRAGHVDEVAGPAIFLASELAAYITGETIYVTGGTKAAAGWVDYPGLGWITAPPLPEGTDA